MCFAQSTNDYDVNITKKLDSLDYLVEHDELDKAVMLAHDIELFLKQNDYKNEAKLKLLKAGLNFYLNNQEKVKEYAEYAYHFFKKEKDTLNLISALNIKGLYEHFYGDKDLDKAIEYYEEAVQFDDGSYNRKNKLLDVYYNLSIIYLNNHQWKKVLVKIDEIIDFARDQGYDSRLIILYHRKAICLIELDRLEEAESCLKESEYYFNRLNEKKQQINNISYGDYLEDLSSLYYKKGNYKKAFHYLKKHNDISKKINTKYLDNYKELLKIKNKILIENEKNDNKIVIGKYKIYLIYAVLIIIVFAFFSILRMLILEKRNRKNVERINKEINKNLEYKISFLNNITHEIKTPLYAILNTSRDLMDNNLEDHDILKQIQILYSSAEFLNNFISDIIETSSTNRLDLKLSLNPLNFIVFFNKIKNVISVSLSKFSFSKSEVVFEWNHKIPKNVLADELKLYRVFFNLISNALKYTRDNNVIKVSAELLELKDTKQSCKILFKVSDKGLGMSQNQIDNIFKAFNRGLRFVEREDLSMGGLGLGLLNVQNILKLYGTTLNIESKKYVGTTMSFVIDFKFVDDFEKTTKKGLISTKKELNVLIVEDNKINQLITTKILEKHKYNCTVVNDGYAAIEIVENKDFDIILLDIMMPGIDGFETAKVIYKKNVTAKIIGLTAIPVSANKEKFMEANIEYVINKPFNHEEFVNILNSL